MTAGALPAAAGRQHLVRPVRDAHRERHPHHGCRLHRRQRRDPGPRDPRRHRRAVVAILFFVTAIIGRWRLPLVGTALLIVSSLIIGSLYPWIIQRFQVDPSAQSLEAPYIERNIDLTRAAYGVDDVETIPYEAQTDAEPGRAARGRRDHREHPHHRPARRSADAFQQLEQFRQYYQFPTHLDVDRYEIDGKTAGHRGRGARPAAEPASARRAPGSTHASSTPTATVVVAAYGNQRSVDGQPVFLQSGIPSTGVARRLRAARLLRRGARRTTRSSAAPRAPTPVELDYPSGRRRGEQQNARPRSRATAGRSSTTSSRSSSTRSSSSPSRSSSPTRSPTSRRSSTTATRIERVQKVAPYLTLDSDTYPSVVDGRDRLDRRRLHATDQLPVLEQVQHERARSPTATRPRPSLPFDDINYIRNSVKATVDAYDGTVDALRLGRRGPDPHRPGRRSSRRRSSR